MLHLPGGGGLGDPALRDPGLVAQDVRAGLVSAEAAARDYKVTTSAERRPRRGCHGRSAQPVPPPSSKETRMIRSRILLLTLLLLGAAPAAQAAEDVIIGAIYPLTGNAAQIGADARAALATESDIINGAQDVPMLLGQGGGLSNLGGAHVRVIFADSQNDPQKARAEAERLITQEHVVAIIGSYTSSTAATISQVTERYQIPYISADNSSPALSKRGLQWFFRTSPNDETFTAAMFDFFKAVGEKTGRPVRSVALIYEDSIFGTDSSNAQRRLAEAAGIRVAADLRYRANSPSLTVEAQRLRAADADVVMPSSYTSDAILLMRVDERGRLRVEGGDGAGGRLPGAGLHHRGRPAGRRRHEPVELRARRGEVAARRSSG